MVRGVSLELHPDGDYLSDEVRRTGDFFEAEVLDEIARRVAPGRLVDVGAHIGNHSTYLAAFIPNRWIDAFEPLLANLAILRTNVAPWPLVEVHPLALSDRSGMAEMVVDQGNIGHSRLEAGGDPVVVRDLDAYAFVDVALLKVDVEGHERQVLAGARETIARCHPLVVIEDWSGAGYGELLPGYRLVREWEQAHQTFMFEAA